MKDKEEVEMDHNCNKVLAIVSVSLLSIIMILGWFIPFFIFNDVGKSGQVTDGWKIYFIIVLFFSLFSMIFPGLKLTSYFYKKYYIK